MIKYARAAGGNWSADATWSTTSGGAADTVAPTAADDVVLDATSGNVTIDTGGTRVCRSIDCNGYTGTITHNAVTTLAIGDATAGAGNRALRFVAGMTYTPGSDITAIISFVSTSATVQDVDFGGRTTGYVEYNGLGGSWKLVSGHTTAVATTVFSFKGTFDTNGQTCSWGKFSLSGSSVRSVKLGASQITLTGGSGTHWDGTTTTNLTFDAGTSTIILSYTSTCTFAGGGLSYNDVIFNIPIGIGLTISGANTFANLSFICQSNTSTSGIQPTLSGNQTITGLFTSTGFSEIARLTILSSSPDTPRTITAASVSLSNTDFIAIIGAGAATWSGTSLGDGGGNSGITFTAPVTRYRVGAGGSWNTSANWSATSGGAGGETVPLCHDTVFVDANATGTIASNMIFIGKDINFTGFTGIYATGTARNVFGSLILSAGMTHAGTTYTFRGVGSHNITSNGQTMGGANGVTFLGHGGTYTLLDALVSTGPVGVSAGNFVSNNFNITCSTWNGANNAIIRSSTLGTSTLTLTLTSAATVFNMSTSHTLSAALATIVISTASANTRTISGNSRVYGTLTYTVAGSTGTLAISGANTFSTINFLDSSNARTLQLSAGEIHTIGILNMIGASGRLLSLTSSSSTNHRISKSSGIMSLDWVNISDSTAEGGAYFAAGNNSVDAGGGNSGWVFGAASFTLTNADGVSVSDAVTKAVDKGNAESVATTHAVTRSVDHTNADNVTTTHAVSKDVSKPLVDAVTTTHASTRAIGKGNADTVQTTHASSKAAAMTLSDAVTATQEVRKDIGKVLNDAVTVSDAQGQVSFQAQTVALVLESDDNTIELENRVT